MEYLIFVNYEQAQVRNAELCFENGCPDEFYFLVITHPTNNEAALILPEDLIFKFTEQEQLEVKDYQYMMDHGWNLN